jgi:hypothetical protein
VDDGASLLRVQCKTGRLYDGVIVFRTASSYAHHPKPKPRQRHYQGQVDAFAVYCPRTGHTILIPIDDVPREEASLRVDPPRNRQSRLIRFAADYEIARVEVTLMPDHRRVA